MRQYLEIAAVPSEEACEQAGENYDAIKACKECRAFIGQLKRLFGVEPKGAQLRTKSFQHDFGVYYEVVCSYEDGNEEAMRYAYQCESEMPQSWDEAALHELGIK